MKTNLFFLFFLLLFFNSFSQIGFQDHILTENTGSTYMATSVFATDIDGDGDMDVLSSSHYDDKIAWYENIDGIGTMGVQQIISTEADGAWFVCAEDIDNDGDIDVLSSSIIDGKIAWYENIDGLGFFGEQQIIITNFNEHYSISPSDIDGDGDMDLLSTTSFGIVWFENLNGLGAFSFEQVLTTNAEASRSVYSTDIDGDGDMDVLSASVGDDKIAWYENIDGLGNFGEQQIISTEAKGAYCVYSVDIDGDGDMDVLSGSNYSSVGVLDYKIAWFENLDGLGSFGQLQLISDDLNHVRSIYTSDIDNDGDMDVLSASYISGEIAWHENINGLGNFTEKKIISTYANEALSVYAADINGDGNMDVLSASQYGGKIVWYKNMDGLGNFGQQQIVTNTVTSTKSVYSSDIDGDGDMDIFCVSFIHDMIMWFENLDGLGNFGEYQIISNDVYGARFITTADIDGDGDEDVLSASSPYILWNSNDSKIAWYENLDGLGNFGQQQIISTNANGANSLFIVDIDSDGYVDVVSSSELDDKIAWYKNMDGLGNFGQQQIITTNANGAKSVYAVDIDNDGNIDILSASKHNNTIAWHKNLDGLGTFGEQQIISVNANEASFVFAEDLDGDGDMDVLSASYEDDKIAWYKNMDGLGDFGVQQIISTETDGPYSVITTDIDNDGDLDVLSASSNYSSSKIAWYENTDGLGVFGEQQIVSTNVTGANSVFAADIDTDGDVDVLSTSGNGTISWHENLGLLGNKIKGTIRLDLNFDGCDETNLPMPDLMVVANNGTNSFSSFTLSNGFYQLYLNEGEYTTAPTPNLPDYFTFNPNSYNTIFEDIGNTEELDFCIEPTQIVNDLNISIIPISEAIPGFDVEYQLIYRNLGTTQLSGNVLLKFEGTKLLFLNSSETNSLQTYNTLTFDFENLNPFETKTIDLIFNVFPPPTVNIDDTLNFIVTINPIGRDYTMDDNIFIFDQVVVGSFDPNDITVIEGSNIFLEDADDYLHYIIRFQNTGTFKATNVKINNKLNINLDWSTLQLESKSHEMYVEIKNGNEVDFIFDKIDLPDSTSNEAESHGFIAYKIKPKSNIAIGDEIFNEADIFFDFNSAVETNTVKTEIIKKTLENNNGSLDFSVFPIPTSGILSIQTTSKIEKIEVYNNSGQVVLSNLNKNNIDITKLSSGLYFCKVTDEKGNSGIKKVVKE